MKLEISNRHDSRGFWLRCALFTLAVHWWPRWRRFPGFCATFQLGRGAGYVSTRWRLGLGTFYMAANAKGGRRYLYTVCPFRMGWTRDGNGVPYHFG